MALRMKSNSVVARSTSRRTQTISCAWKKAGVTADQVAKADGGRMVVELGGTKVLLANAEGEIYAVSNKCSHLGLPIVGKTGAFQGKVSGRCVTCPAHGTQFDLATGEVQGKWCPSLPEAVATGFGLTPKKPLPTFKSRVTEGGDVEVDM